MSERRRCAETLTGQKIGRVVARRRPCKRLADKDSDRCWQHRPDRNEIWSARHPALPGADGESEGT